MQANAIRRTNARPRPNAPPELSISEIYEAALREGTQDPECANDEPLLVGAHLDSNKSFAKSAPRRTGGRATLHAAARLTLRVEHILVQDFDARGRGMHSKVDSVRPPLPRQLAADLRYLGALVNTAVAENALDPAKLPDILERTTKAVHELRRIAIRRNRFKNMRQRLRTAFGRIGKHLAWD
jgi:hypothetical protein